MSKVAIQGNASGTGTFTIAAPNSNTDRTLTLPDEAGTVVTTAGADFTGDVTTTGNIGIGTSSPSVAIHLADTEAETGIQLGTGADLTIKRDVSESAGIINVGSDLNNLRLNTGGTERMRLASNGYLKCQGVYDQSAADSANVVVDGSGNIYRSTSALKYKQNVRDLESIDISTFRPVRYKSRAEKDDQTLDHFGFIADEFHDAGLTELVSYGAVDEETGVAEVEGFRYDRMTAVLTKALQDALDRIETLETTVADLQTRVTALEAN